MPIWDASVRAGDFAHWNTTPAPKCLLTKLLLFFHLPIHPVAYVWSVKVNLIKGLLCLKVFMTIGKKKMQTPVYAIWTFLTQSLLLLQPHPLLSAHHHPRSTCTHSSASLNDTLRTLGKLVCLLLPGILFFCSTLWIQLQPVSSESIISTMKIFIDSLPQHTLHYPQWANNVPPLHLSRHHYVAYCLTSHSGMRHCLSVEFFKESAFSP